MKLNHPMGIDVKRMVEMIKMSNNGGGRCQIAFLKNAEHPFEKRVFPGQNTEGNIPAPEPGEDSTPETAESADDASSLGAPGSIPVVAGTSAASDATSSGTASADQNDVPLNRRTSVNPFPHMTASEFSDNQSDHNL
ncbi:unnamed protein product [Ranitomeya imitator]|uniref:Uncharacterized protein n=1 Tax=Ranitomeya imitator TaxID=111125 RepID=A0ABN9MCH8_9NEOB|nr:unnamed protein product [Ranitomeya imitator]